MSGAIKCGNGTKQGRICKRWVPLGGQCPYHGRPFLVRYPDLANIFDLAIIKHWDDE